MNIPATSSGIASLEAATQPNENGCAFACHERVPDDLQPFRVSSGAPISCTVGGAYADGTAFTADSKFPYTGRDNYDLARCLGSTLRIDLVRSAVRDLIGTMALAKAKTGAHYRLALFETNVDNAVAADEVSVYTADPQDQLDACGRRSKQFDVFALQTLTDDFRPTGPANSAAQRISAMEVYDNNHQLSGHQNCNMDTNLDIDLVKMDELIPAAISDAQRSRAASQNVLFVVTDAFDDPAPDREFGPMDWDGSRCRAIKDRGIRIAVLYTTYYSGLLAKRRLVDEPDFAEWLPKLPRGLPPHLGPSAPVGSDPMALAAGQCASPGLYSQVNTDGDVSAAMRTLFERAVQTSDRQ